MIHAGPGPEHGAEINGENVALDDLNIFEAHERHAQLRRQHAVEFYGNEAAGTLGQHRGQDAAAGADFNHSLV